jgi:hypothetical protein
MLFIICIGIIAAMLQACGYLSYYKLTEKPNAASWLIWFYGNALMLVSYTSFTHVTWIESLPILCAILNIAIVILFFIQKKFTWPDKTEWLFVGVDILITLLWFVLTHVPSIANFYHQTCGIRLSCDVFIHILLLGSAIVSFVPILRQTLHNADDEHPRPWLFWSMAYAVWLVAEILHRDVDKSVEWWSVLYPTVYFGLHVAMAMIVTYKKQSQQN